MPKGEYKRDFRRLFWLKETLRGFHYVGHRQYDGWRGYLPFYRIHCRKHGFVEDYPHGYGRWMSCPKCFSEAFGRVKSLEEE